jgi:YfiH family protein
LENRRRAAEALSKKPSDLVWVRCVHGADLVHATPDMKGTDPKCDAIVTSQPQLVIGMGTADCGSLIVSEPNKSFAALIHAGWKGLGSGIIPQTITKLSDMFSVEPKEFIVGSGPLACGSCYEFGPEAEKLFDKRYVIHKNGTRYLDMRAMILDELHACGVRKIDDSTICTMEDERFFSYRRDNDPTVIGGFGIFPAFTSL